MKIKNATANNLQQSISPYNAKAYLEGGDLIDLDPSFSPVAVGTVEFLTVIPD